MTNEDFETNPRGTMERLKELEKIVAYIETEFDLPDLTLEALEEYFLPNTSPVFSEVLNNILNIKSKLPSPPKITFEGSDMEGKDHG